MSALETLTPLEEERQARERRRQGEKLLRAKRDADLRREREAIAQAIAETRARHSRCRCGLRRGMTREDLRALGSGCCSRYVCPRLDTVRRRVGL